MATPTHPTETAPENRGLVETAKAIARPDDHVKLMLVNGAVLTAGLVAKNRGLTRAGVRMIVAQGVAVAGRTLWAGGAHAAGENTAEEAADSAAGQPGLSAEEAQDDAIETGSSAEAVAVAKAAADASPIPYVPARIATYLVTGSDRPKKANPVIDFAIGMAVGWLSEKIASRLLGRPDKEASAQE